MNCDEAKIQIIEVLIHPESEAKPLAHHLDDCEHCQRRAEELAHLWNLLGTDPDIPLPALAKLRISAVLAGAAGTRRLVAPRFETGNTESRTFGSSRIWRVAAAILIAMTVGGTIGYLAGGRQSGQAGLGSRAAAVRDIAMVGLDTGNPRVRITFDQPAIGRFEGSLQDEKTLSILTSLVTNLNLRESVRSRAALALRDAASDRDEARSALLQALSADPNPSVRLKAARALLHSASDPLVRQTFLEVLRMDPNPGLRILAVDALSASAEPVGAEDIDVLRDIANDPESESYVRVKAAKLLSEL